MKVTHDVDYDGDDDDDNDDDYDNDEDDDLGAFQGSRDNWMTGEAEIPATLAFLDIGADISQFHYKIFP